MRLTNYEKNVLAMLDRKVSEYIAKQQARAMRKSVVPNVLLLGNPDKRIWEEARKSLRNLLPSLARMTPSQIAKGEWTMTHALVLRTLMAKMWDSYIEVPKKSPHSKVAHAAMEIVRGLHESADTLELECMLPPERKHRNKRPATLVGRRAAIVDSKVKEWERKLKYARTRLKTYRRKQKYYAKKGAVV